MKWFRRAAKAGLPSAMLSVATMYDEGRGVPQDDIEAYVWYSLAFSLGVEAAAHLRDEVARKLTPEARLEAQAVSRKRFEDIERTTKE